MKRLLIATTAAVTLVGSAAYAESTVTVSGDARLGLAHDSADTMDFNVERRFRVIFGASGTTDNGLAFGAGVKVQSNRDVDGQSNGVSNATVSVSSDFGKLTFGENDSDPADVLLGGGVADLGYDGIGVDNVAESGRGAGTNAAILYEQSVGGVKLAASFGPVGDDIQFALGMEFKTDGIRIGAGFDSNDGMALGAGYALNDELTFNGYYAEEEDIDSVGGDLSYGLGNTTLTVAFGTNSMDHKSAGLGISHNLGGKAKLVAGFGQMDDAKGEHSGAEVGLTFEF